MGLWSTVLLTSVGKTFFLWRFLPNLFFFMLANILLGILYLKYYKYFSPRNKRLGNLASYVFQHRLWLQYVVSDMSNKYFIAQIAENTFVLHWEKSKKKKKKKKKKKEMSDYPPPGEIKLKISRLFFQATSIFSDAEVKVVGNSIVRFFEICPWNWLKINKSGELTRMMTFGCFVNHDRKFA